MAGAAVGSDGPPQCEWGRLAQRIRGLAAYRAAQRVFVGPSPLLSQVRVNALCDGKELLMPAPSLKEGFYLCLPYAIPFADLAYATSYRGLPKYGRLLDNRGLAAKQVGMLVTDAVAVDPVGTRLGDGKGFFDLSCAILAELGAVERRGATVVALAADEQLVKEELLPFDPWDIRLDEVITPLGGRVFTDVEHEQPAIHWSELPPERVRRMNPLWQLAEKRRRD
ncbi:MAG: 5-formyltetrahydrofolate cyclo-ligase [Desulfobulbaceae bacterium]|nr:5-formyltetrahydrofolate cyclo-ligase [Desulfobulbaceae bacterium]